MCVRNNIHMFFSTLKEHTLALESCLVVFCKKRKFKLDTFPEVFFKYKKNIYNALQIPIRYTY